MLTQQTLDKLYAMKLNGIADALKELIQQPHTQYLSFEERVALIVDRQWTWKEDRRLKRLLHIARLKINACTEDIDFKTPRGLDKSVILHLAQCEWITNTQNIIITVPLGWVKPISPARWQTELAGWASNPTTSGCLACSRNSPSPEQTALTQSS